MKKKRSLMIVLGVLILISLFYLLLTLPRKNKIAEKSGEENIAILNSNDIESIEIRPFDEEAFTIVVDGHEGNRGISIEGYDESFEFNMALLLKLVGSLENLKAYDLIEGEGEDYGINDESPEAIIHFNDNSILTLRFGAETRVNQGVYVHAEEHERIYVVRKDIKDICNSSIYTFRKPQLIPTEYIVQNNYVFSRIEIHETKGDFITIRPQTIEEAQNNKSDAPSMYVIESPVFWEASDGRIFSQIIDPILSLEKDAIVVEDFPEDLTKYGITQDSSSIRLEIKDRIVNILFGEETDSGYLYASTENMNSVVKIPKDSVSMLNLKWYHLVNTNLWMVSIDKIKSFTLETSEKNYDIIFKRDEDGELIGGFVNNLPVDDTILKDIYIMLLNIHIEGRNIGGTLTSTPEYKIKIHLLDGTNESFEFLLGKGREYSIIKNGVDLGFYTGTTSLVSLVNSLENLR